MTSDDLLCVVLETPNTTARLNPGGCTPPTPPVGVQCLHTESHIEHVII